MTKRPSVFSETLIVSAKAELLDGLLEGIYHLHYYRLKTGYYRWLLEPSDDHNHPICKTNRCLPLGVGTEVKVL